MLNVKEFNDYFENDQDFLAFADGLKVKMFDAEGTIPQKIIIIDEPIDEHHVIYITEGMDEAEVMQVLGVVIRNWRK